MNIAFFTNNYKPFIGGVETSISFFKQALEKQGHKVYIFAPSYPKQEKEDDVIRISSVEAPTHKGFYLPMPFLPLVEREFKKLDIDLVHLHQPFLLGDAGMALAAKYQLPLVFTYHTLYEEYLHYVPITRKLAKNYLDSYVSAFCNNCDMVIAPSTYVKDSIKKKDISTKVKVLPTGIDILEYDEIPKGSVRDEYHLADHTRILLFAGRIGKEKNIDFLIDCVAQTVKGYRDSICFFVGDGTYLKDAKEKVKQLNLQHKIIFTGSRKRKELFRFYKDTDLFVFASKSETQGLVLLEAMAASTPVLAIRGPAIDDIIKPDYNGYIVEEDRDAFAKQAVKILVDKSKLDTLSANAHKTAEEYSMKNSAQKLLDIYNRLISSEAKDKKQKIRMLTEIDWKQLMKAFIRS